MFTNFSGTLSWIPRDSLIKCSGGRESGWCFSVEFVSFFLLCIALWVINLEGFRVFYDCIFLVDQVFMVCHCYAS